MVRRVKGGFMKLKFKVVLPKEKKNDLLLLKEGLSKGGFIVTMHQLLHI